MTVVPPLHASFFERMKGASYASICVRPSARDEHYRHLCRLVEATIARAAVYLAKKLCIQHIEHIEHTNRFVRARPQTSSWLCT